MRWRLPGGRAGLHVCTQRDQRVRAVRERGLPVRGVRVHDPRHLHPLYSGARGGAGAHTVNIYISGNKHFGLAL